MYIIKTNKVNLLNNFFFMFKRIIPCAFFFVFATSLFGQTVRKVVFETPIGHTQKAAQRAPCVDNSPGTIGFSANVTGMSNSIPATQSVTYLCFGDEFNINHNNDATLNSDPDASTRPGIGYAIYTCEPTVDGPDITTIIGDCLLGNPSSATDILIMTDATDPHSGNVLLQNAGNPNLNNTFQAIYNNGDPLQLWFAPINYDGINANDEIVYEGNPSGPCVSVNTADRFSVVFLNSIEILNTVYPFGGDGSKARLSIKGGLPEFDENENYTITVRNVDDPSITGQVLEGPHGNRDFVVIKVPQTGTYEVVFSDGVSCSTPTRIEMNQSFQKDIVSFESSGGTYTVGQEICIDVTTKDFNNILGFFHALHWDTSLLEFVRLDFTDAFLTENDAKLHKDSMDYALVSYFNPNLNTINLDDDTKILSICFIAKAEGMTKLQFTNDPRAPLNGPNADVVSQDADGNTIESTPNFTEGTITIVDPNKLTPTISMVRDACPGDSNGSFELNIVGGQAPYEISVTGPVNKGPISNVNAGDVTAFDQLPPGDYEIIIRQADVTANFARETVTITEANLFVDAEVASPVTCNGDSDGSMTVTVRKNGVEVTDLADYNFVWTNFAGDTVSTSQTATNLPSDNQYTVFVSDPNSCSTSNGTGLPQTNPLNIVLDIVQQPTCSGVEDGALTISSVDGGLPPFNYNWSNGVNMASNSAIEEGKYIITITDDNGCSAIDSTQLVATTSINTNPLTTNVLCHSGNDGEITLTATVSGTGNTIPSANGYVFNWSANAPNPMETGSRSIQSNLGQGDYTVTVTHPELPAGCMAVETYSISEPDSLIISNIDITPVTSCVVADGAATVTVTGGTIANDYQYTWNDPAGQNTQTATGLAADSITIFVNDDNGCNAQLDTIIGTPPPPVVQFFDNDSVNCASDAGNLQLVASPGRPGVNIRDYRWSHDMNLNQANAFNLAPGTYYVTIVDEDECATLDSAVVFSPPAITLDTTIFVEPCFETAAGRISINISGGTPSMAGQPYQIAWSDGSTNSVLAGVEAGDYMLKITDGNACEFDTTITLNHLPRIVVNFDGITGVDCFDNINPADCNGAATGIATYENGTPGIFDFIWSTGETVNGADQSSSNTLCAGMQELLVSDGQCQVTEMVEIPSPPQLLYDVDNSTTTPVTCNGQTDGSATVAAIGGTPGYTFAWPNGNNGANIANLAAGTYTVTITDRNGCITPHDIEITEPEALSVGLDFDNTSNVTCAGDDDGRIQVIVVGGNQGGFNYNWTNNVSNGPSAAGLAPGNYTIEVTDNKGCTGSTQYTVSQPPAMSADISFSPIQCFGFQTTISVANAQGGNGGAYQFSVDNSPPQPLDIVIPVFGGNHSVTIFDAKGCQIDNDVNIPEPAEVTITFPSNLVEVDLGSSITLEPEVFSSVPIADLVWSSGGASVDSSFICNSVLCDKPTVNPLNNISYTLMVTDQNGCSAEESITVEVDKNRNVYIPNVFAPNNTGFDTNDRFEVFTGSGVKSINFARVFNRWGTMVAEIKDPVLVNGNTQTFIWDGKHKGDKANQGVYIYIIEVEFIDKIAEGSDQNTKLLYRGDITLLR
jgi:hypothetical protein